MPVFQFGPVEDAGPLPQESAMLSDKSFPVIEATLPLVGSRIGEITPKFYARLFGAHPELLDGLFSRSNQRSGDQQQALAGSIAAIAEDLAEVITPEIAEAWTEVYWLMADALIKLEKGLYAAQANGKMWSPWKVAAKTPAGTGSMTFVLEPADDTPITPALPGQYVSVKVTLPEGLRQVRQYSLSGDAGTSRSFTTKLDDGGEVSPVLHNNVEVGDVLEISNPYGEITLKEDEGPVVLASAGIGCTPSASILRSLAASGSDRQVLVLHAESTLDSWALRSQMTDDVERLGGAELQLWLERPEAGAREGFMSLRDVDLPANASLYLCGPLPFMKNIRNEAINAGIPATKIHYEVFGPDIWLAN